MRCAANKLQVRLQARGAGYLGVRACCRSACRHAVWIALRWAARRLLLWCGVVRLRRTFKFEPVARPTQEDSGGGLAGAGDNRRGTCLFQEFAVPSWTGPGTWGQRGTPISCAAMHHVHRTNILVIYKDSMISSLFGCNLSSLGHLCRNLYVKLLLVCKVIRIRILGSSFFLPNNSELYDSIRILSDFINYIFYV
jgi:hypothetical protein